MRIPLTTSDASWVCAGIDDKDLIELCYGSADFREGLDAFLVKRTPKFVGR